MAKPTVRSPVMVDPSLFGSDAFVAWFRGLSSEDLSNLISPAEPLSLLRQNASAARRFFQIREEASDPLVFERFAAIRVWPSDATDRLRPAGRDVLRSLDHIEDPLIRRVLISEWSYLQTDSWLLSRLKKPFTQFYRHGAEFLQLGARRTLKLPSDAPIGSHELKRAGVKWIAVTGSSATALVAPAAAVAVSLATGFFLLLDP